VDAKTRPPMIRIITYVLDDDIEELELLKPYLEKVCACDFQMYTDVSEFICAIQEGCHIAIVDFNLNAKIDGIEVGRMVLEKNPLCFLILFSGMDDKRTIINAMNTGFRYCVDKNSTTAYQQVADVVDEQREGIKNRMETYDNLLKLNRKYQKYLVK
jgi:DNA-binding NtrC family response regulator